MSEEISSKVKALADALNEANMIALGASGLSTDDMGTCNMDSVVIRLPRWKQDEIDKVTELSGVTFSDKLSGLWKGYRFVNTTTMGQANRRTRMVEAAKKHLQSKGYEVAVYYAMD